jgi:hypothetical protein
MLSSFCVSAEHCSPSQQGVEETIAERRPKGEGGRPQDSVVFLLFKGRMELSRVAMKGLKSELQHRKPEEADLHHRRKQEKKSIAFLKSKVAWHEPRGSSCPQSESNQL